jgi:hypothetical protein
LNTEGEPRVAILHRPKNAVFSLNSSYACPEPVLAKRLIKPHIKRRQKRRFFRTSAANLKSSWNFDKTGFFGVFPNVCPEPVLVKSSFLYINGSKSPFSYRYGGEERGNDVENRAPDVHQLHAVVDQLARISTCSEQEILRC